MNKWEKILDAQDILSIEVFTHDWMRYFGYEPAHSCDQINNLNINDYKRLEHESLARWIRPFAFDSDKERLANELLVEKLHFAEGMDLSPGEKMRLHLKWW